jgi:hypothetical protein
MAQIVAANASLLKEAGFRKRRHSFNRATADGLVHVVYFWMAPKEPPAWTEVPGLRTRLYGNFRLDFGVHVPEMRRGGTPKSDWINEYNCHLRRTIGQLMASDSRSDLWWSLHDERATQYARAAIHDHGLPWLDQFPSKEAVLARFEAVGPFSLGMSPAGGLDIAEMLSGLGRPADARRILEGYVERAVLPPHARYLATYLREIGHGDLVPRIHVKP